MLVAERQIVARGTFGALLTSTPHEPVYDGDAPYRPPTISTEFAQTARDFAATMEEWLRAARAQPGPAGQMLQMLTWYDTTPEKVVNKRDYLIRQGIPPEFLHLNPQPLWGRSVTANEAAVILVREGFEPAEARQAVGAFLAEIRQGFEFGDERPDTVERGCITEDDLGQLRARLSL
ncbi:hypothetical protein [Nocardia carnea]|uniref:hypothetical protein n=1 Tax=Nocardia carnea TaxID=37328 RepID=UPI002458D58D|nr:hypothetical protein [Nocardia carnea]